MINEFRKQNEYQKIYANFYFWRNTDQREINLVIEKNNQLKAIEIKWNPPRKTRLTKSFTHIYGETSFTLINRENFFEEIGGEVLSQFVLKTT